MKITQNSITKLKASAKLGMATTRIDLNKGKNEVIAMIWLKT